MPEIEPQARWPGADAAVATLLAHKPSGMAGSASTASILVPAQRWEGDDTGTEFQARHLNRQTLVMPLEAAACGLLVFTQDPRLLHRLREDASRLEQEFNVEVSGEIAPYGLRRLEHGLAFAGRNLPPAKVSWQSETRLRFALKDVREGQLESMCNDVGLTVLSIKRIRIGRVPLSKMPVGTWRYLPGNERL